MITGGEWRAIKAPMPTGYAEWQIAWSPDDELVADVIYSEDDAVLMAASPDMLAACKSSLDRFGRLEKIAIEMREYGLQAMALDAIAELKAAIGKAKGKEAR